MTTHTLIQICGICSKPSNQISMHVGHHEKKKKRIQKKKKILFHFHLHRLSAANSIELRPLDTPASIIRSIYVARKILYSSADFSTLEAKVSSGSARDSWAAPGKFSTLTTLLRMSMIVSALS